MFDSTKQFLIHCARVCLLKGYGWKSQKTMSFGEPAVMWRDPFSYVWVSETAALKLLTVHAMDEFHHR